MKKGQIAFENGSNLVLIFGILIIILAFLSLIISNLQDSQPVYTTTYTNEEINLINASAVDLTGSNLLSGQIVLLNSSNSVVIGSANYTVSNSAGTVTLISPTYYNNTDANATYNWTERVYDYYTNITIEGNKGILNYSVFTPTIGTVIAALLILSLVILGIGGFIRYNK